MPVEAFRMRNFHAAKDELAPGDQLMNVITNAHVNHGVIIGGKAAPTIYFPTKP